MEFLDWLTVITFFIATPLGVYEVYRIFFGRPRISLFLGEGLDLVASFEQYEAPFANIRKLHIYCVCLNKSEKTGVIKRLMLELRNIRTEEKWSLKWDQFFVEIDGAMRREPEALYAYPIAVEGKTSILKKVQFIIPRGKLNDQFGAYELTVKAWVMNSLKEPPDVRSDKRVFIFDGAHQYSIIQKTLKLKGPGFETIRLS